MHGWRLILGTGAAAADLDPARGALNMAIDEALLESVRQSGRPVIRFYTWSPACLSFGRNQHTLGVYDRGRATAAGIDVVRRPTGGLAVLHDRELTYCVLAPLALFAGPRAAYARINRALVEGLRACGVAAGQAAASSIRGPLKQTAEPCFQAPAAGEIIAAGRKLVGSAQRCERGALLQHGSILLGGSQSRVLDLLAGPGPAPAREGSVTLAELLGVEPPAHRVMDALRSGFERSFGTRLAPEPLTRDESASVERLVARYEAGDWTWRR